MDKQALADYPVAIPGSSIGRRIIGPVFA